ncbi:hypothetical protein ACFL39_02600, partial [Gemmatimonadota bacterium]
MWEVKYWIGFAGLILAYIALALYMLLGFANISLPFVPTLPGKYLIVILGVSCWLGSYLLAAICSLVLYRISANTGLNASRRGLDIVHSIRDYHEIHGYNSKPIYLSTQSTINDVVYFFCEHIPLIVLTIIPIILISIGIIIDNEFLINRSVPVLLLVYSVLLIPAFLGEVNMLPFAAIGFIATVIIVFFPGFNLLISLTEKLIAGECIICGILAEFE